MFILTDEYTLHTPNSKAKGQIRNSSMVVLATKTKNTFKSSHCPAFLPLCDTNMSASMKKPQSLHQEKSRSRCFLVWAYLASRVRRR